MARPLTAMAIKKFRPTKERREIRDGGCMGLYLVIQVSGFKSFAMRFRRPDGRPAKLTLGPVDLSGDHNDEAIIGTPLTLASARHLASEINRQRARGQDVHRRVQGSGSMFVHVARDFIKDHAKPKLRRWQQQARMLGFTEDLEVIRGGLAERWSKKDIEAITSHDVHTLIDECRRKGVPGLGRHNVGSSDPRARAVYACLSKMFSWALQHRRVEKNPCAGVHKPAAPMARDRVLTDNEIKAFWAASSLEPQGSLLKLLLLTGCRLNEVAGMQRAELSGDQWTIPGSRTKNHRVHVVSLSPLALRQVPTGEGDGLVFTNGSTPISGWSKIKKRLDQRMKIPAWRLHDLRRTAATGMAGLGVAPHVVEAAINHVSGAKSGVAGTYNRHAYAEEKKAALALWADHIRRITSRA